MFMQSIVEIENFMTNATNSKTIEKTIEKIKRRWEMTTKIEKSNRESSRR